MNNLYLGSLDILILFILIAINVIIYLKFRSKTLRPILLLEIVLLYAIVLPLISQIVEVKRVVVMSGVDDGFTLLYTYLRFPLYWLLGYIQLMFIAIFYKSERMKKS